MRRVIAFWEFKAEEWAKCATGRPGLPLELLDGVRAYATRQAAIRRERATSLRTLFSSALVGDDSTATGTSLNDTLLSPTSKTLADDDSDVDSCASDFDDDL